MPWLRTLFFYVLLLSPAFLAAQRQARILNNIDRVRITPLNILNSTYRETNLSITPDGKYLFFMSGKTDTSLVTQHDIITMKDLHQLAEKPENGNPDIYWINAAFISKLKPEGF